MALLAASSSMTTTNAASSYHPDGGDNRKLPGVKHLLDTAPNMKKLPPEYVLKLPPTKPISACDQAIPVIDLSGLDGPVGCRMQTVRAISDACADWGFFRIKNHGIKFSLMEEMVNAVDGFFNLPWEEKMKYASDDVMNPIRYGTSLNTSKQHDLHWRDYLRHFGIPFRKSIGLWPNDPPTYRVVAKEYLEEQWKLSLKIAGAISEGLGLERNYIEKTLGEGCQIMASNYYPPCPEPDRTLGLAPHSDHGGVIVLMENGVPGLHVKHNDQWVAVQHVPGTFVVNIGDYIEILSNGRYRSVEHRAAVNAERTRISIATSLGPQMTTMVQPAAQLLDEKSKLKYQPIAYQEYMRFQQTKPERAGKSPLQALLVAHNSIESFVKSD